MTFLLKRRVLAVIAAVCLFLPGMIAAHAQERVALVVGIGAFAGEPGSTALNDAGLMSATLRLAGFDVTEGANLSHEALRRAVAAHAERLQRSGPNAVSFVYIAANAVNFQGETYVLPVDAPLLQMSNVAQAGVALRDVVRALEPAPAAARFLVLDIGRPAVQATPGNGVGRGTAPVPPVADMLVAVNQAPHRVAPPSAGSYGSYALALTEMLRQPALDADRLFQRVRLRVHERSAGDVTPWHDHRLRAGVRFFDARPSSAPEAAADERLPGRGASLEEAYAAAVERNTVAVYDAFLAAHPTSPLARRVRVLVAQKREAEFWLRAVAEAKPDGYWAYLKYYAHGQYAEEARRRLAALKAPAEPPASFAPAPVADLPPPPLAEAILVARRFAAFEPLPAPPSVPPTMLASAPVLFATSGGAPQPAGPGRLPTPAAPVPLHASAVAPPLAPDPPRAFVPAPATTTASAPAARDATPEAAARGAAGAGLTLQDLQQRDQELRARERTLAESIRAGRVSRREGEEQRQALREERRLLDAQRAALGRPGSQRAPAATNAPAQRSPAAAPAAQPPQPQTPTQPPRGRAPQQSTAPATPPAQAGTAAPVAPQAARDPRPAPAAQGAGAAPVPPLAPDRAETTGTIRRAAPARRPARRRPAPQAPIALPPALSLTTPRAP